MNVAAVEVVAEFGRRVQQQVGRAVTGLEPQLQQCLIALLARGHVLIEGPPGVAKTLFARALAAASGLQYSRVQFTPDLMPADITGTSVFHPGQGTFAFLAGPLFAQVLLCDEINRAPAKTQAALLEAMQEGAVTVDGRRHPLPQPFFVLATMNPVEHEGTYPLPEAQLDRFLFKVLIDYPEADVEAQVLSSSHDRDPLSTPADLGVEAISDGAELLSLSELANQVRVREDLPPYVVRLLQATRSNASLVLGASPRAGVMLLRGAKCRAALEGREYVTPDDVKALFLPALRHRVALEPAEELEGADCDAVLQRILDGVEVPR